MTENILFFILAAGTILFIGPRLSRAADEVGRRTGIGATLAGALFIGATTSLPGLIITFNTALEGFANIAVSNSMGGVAAQTLFIGIADAALRKGHLTHRNILEESLIQTAVVIVLLTLILMAIVVGDYTFFHLHPLSPVILITIFMGFLIVREAKRNPQWEALHASALAEDKKKREPNPLEKESRSSLIGKYIVYAVIISGGGVVISYTGTNVVEATGMSPVIMGATFMALAASLPDLVTATASVRRGSVGLAIGNIVGGNAFDTIMVVVADIAYTEGSIFNVLDRKVSILVVTTLLMTAVLLIGLIRREKRGLANIGIESYLIMIIYAGAMLMIFLGN